MSSIAFIYPRNFSQIYPSCQIINISKALFMAIADGQNKDTER